MPSAVAGDASRISGLARGPSIENCNFPKIPSACRLWNILRCVVDSLPFDSCLHSHRREVTLCAGDAAFARPGLALPSVLKPLASPVLPQTAQPGVHMLEAAGRAPNALAKLQPAVLGSVQPGEGTAATAG